MMAQSRIKLLGSWINVSKCLNQSRRISNADTSFIENLKLSPGGSITLHRNEKAKVDIIQLEHAEKKNAISGHMVLQLSEVVSKLETGLMENKRAVLITGAGDAFCAGADLHLVENNVKSDNFCRNFSAFVYDVLFRFNNLPVPTIALINGPAFGGGAELAIACDLRLVTPSGQLSFVHGRMGLTPAFGGVTRLVQLLGAARAFDLLATGRNLQGKDLVDWGIASGRVIGEEEAITWIEENLRAKISTQMVLKRLVQFSAAKSQAESIAYERENFIRQWGGIDHLQALNKYRGKRD